MSADITEERIVELRRRMDESTMDDRLCAREVCEDALDLLDSARSQLAALKAGAQSVELTEDDVRGAIIGTNRWCEATATLNAWIRARLVPTPPQPAPGAVVIRDPDDDDWDAFGFQQGTRAEVLRVWNRAIATCKDSLQVPQPLQPEERRVGPDEVDSFTVSAVYAAINRGCKVGIPGIGCCGDRDMMRKPILCPSCAVIKSRMPDALRASAQDHNGEESR